MTMMAQTGKPLQYGLFPQVPDVLAALQYVSDIYFLTSELQFSTAQEYLLVSINSEPDLE